MSEPNELVVLSSPSRIPVLVTDTDLQHKGGYDVRFGCDQHGSFCAIWHTPGEVRQATATVPAKQSWATKVQ
jgi:hypothetical protein